MIVRNFNGSIPWSDLSEAMGEELFAEFNHWMVGNTWSGHGPNVGDVDSFLRQRGWRAREICGQETVKAAWEKDGIPSPTTYEPDRLPFR